MVRGFRLKLCLVLLAVLFVVTMQGCGGQTEGANRLVDEANMIIKELNPKLRSAQGLIEQGADYLDVGDIEKGKQSLSAGSADLDMAISNLKTAKAKYEEAAALDIGNNHRLYLEAVIRGQTADIRTTEALARMVQLLLADPAVTNPATSVEVKALKDELDKQAKLSEEANAEADRIAAKHADEFKNS
ncbi:MAG: hypothetical protein AAB281_07370 [Actinomycetota bacterium]